MCVCCVWFCVVHWSCSSLQSACASPAPGAIAQPLLFQLVVGLWGRSQASGEVAGRARAPPTGEHRIHNKDLYTEESAHKWSEKATVSFLFCLKEQYKRDQERLEAEWRKDQQDAVEDLFEKSGVVCAEFSFLFFFFCCFFICNHLTVVTTFVFC